MPPAASKSLTSQEAVFSICHVSPEPDSLSVTETEICIDYAGADVNHAGPYRALDQTVQLQSSLLRVDVHAPLGRERKIPYPNKASMCP